MNYQNNEIGYIGFIDLMSKLKGKNVQKVYENVRNFETKFFGYWRMSSLDELSGFLRPHISRSNTSIRLAISTEERLNNNYKVSKQRPWI